MTYYLSLVLLCFIAILPDCSIFLISHCLMLWYRYSEHVSQFQYASFKPTIGCVDFIFGMRCMKAMANYWMKCSLFRHTCLQTELSDSFIIAINFSVSNSSSCLPVFTLFDLTCFYSWSIDTYFHQRNILDKCCIWSKRVFLYYKILLYPPTNFISSRAHRGKDWETSVIQLLF